MRHPGDLPGFINPFQRHMRTTEQWIFSDFAFEAPLPLSATSDAAAPISLVKGVFHLAEPSLHLVALEGEATTTELASRRWLSLLYVTEGEICLHQANQQLWCAAGDCLFVPESAAVWDSSAYSVVCLMFAPQQFTSLLQVRGMAELDWLGPETWDLATPTCRKASEGDVAACLLSTLHHLLHATSELALQTPRMLTRLGITNQLCLLTALLGCPPLSAALVAEKKAQKEGGVDEAIDDLTNYMLTHLSQPLNLTMLEKYSHYSRRSLQYAFRQRFGCTITQWIRAKRLDHAYQALQSGSAGKTVASVANACGYRSVSLFSIEFQNRFHIKPSVLLRENKNND